MMADLILIRHYGLPALHWGGGDLRGDGAPRGAYHQALHQADAGNLQPLLNFAALAAPQ